MKQLFAIILGLMLSFSLFACSEAEVDTDIGVKETQIKLTFATPLYVEVAHKKALDQLLAAYKDVAPNVTIEIYSDSFVTYWDTITKDIKNNSEADIFQMYPENIAPCNYLRLGGVFVNLQRFMGDEIYTDKLVGQDMCGFGNSTLALSNYAWGTSALFYRKSILADNGIAPEDIKSWKDFVDTSAKLKSKDIFGMGIVTSNHGFIVSEWSQMLARVVSDGLYFPNGETGPFAPNDIQVNTAPNIWAAEQWQAYLNNGYGKRALNEKDKREYFYNGHVAFCYDGPWLIDMINEYDTSLLDDVGIIPAPSVGYNSKNYKPNPTMYPVTMSMSQHCRNQKEAWDFMKWMASDEAQKIIASSGMIPSSKQYSSSDEYKAAYPKSSLFAEFLNNYAPPVSDPIIPELGELRKVMVEATQAMFVENSNADCKTILDKAAVDCNAIMEK